MQKLFEWDRTILKYINLQWNNPFFDSVLPFLRNSDVWVPFYLFMLLFAVINYKKTSWWWVVIAVITGVLSDYISSDLIKPNFFRVRPCNDPSLASWLRILPGLHFPQSSSFTSSHAVNHFAFATFLFLTLKKEIGNIAWLFWLGRCDLLCSNICGCSLPY
jgi:hypothetical protein